ncbi:MAG: hypothetical protein ACUVTM_06480 [Candidatus Bathyarchaeia archaeon]
MVGLTDTVESMDLEIKWLLDDLPTYIDYLSSIPSPEASTSNGRKCIFTGAGDSYAAALAAERLSGYRALCLDPYEISRSPDPVEGKHLYVISVSGRTRSNIEAARKVRGRASKVTAITANRNSILASLCDDLIELKYRSAGTLTPGTASFTMSLLASYSRITSIPQMRNLHDTYDEALTWASGVNIQPESTTILVGTGLAYPFTMYGKAKIIEVLGSKAQAQLTEQFSHMDLFSLTRKDLTIIIQEGHEDVQAERIHRLLEENSYRTVLLPMVGKDKVEASVRLTFHLQLLALTTARRLGVRDCAFTRDPQLLHLSDEMIYHKD